jgi:lipoprotein-anchoring transpeptidase ErfK/SrfK
MTKMFITRRNFLKSSAVTSVAFLHGCQSMPQLGARPPASVPVPTAQEGSFAQSYAAKFDAGFEIPAVPWEKIDRRFLRQEVADNTGVGPGKIVVETSQHFLYFTVPDGRAMRYGVGLGREGFEWTGTGEVRNKQEWPKWHPPAEMIDRVPELEEFRTTYNKETDTWEGGMAPGLMNPLGARAHYIFQGEKDTLYRIHGSPEWWSIGKSVSSGCVRLINQDIIDLYNRVGIGAEIIVR